MPTYQVRLKQDCRVSRQTQDGQASGGLETDMSEKVKTKLTFNYNSKHSEIIQLLSETFVSSVITFFKDIFEVFLLNIDCSKLQRVHIFAEHI